MQQLSLLSRHFHYLIPLEYLLPEPRFKQALANQAITRTDPKRQKDLDMQKKSILISIRQSEGLKNKGRTQTQNNKAPKSNWNFLQVKTRILQK